jgi:pimeloyl-ACP methyl ester carboxylesterase
VATCNGLCNRCRWLDYIGPVSNGLGNQLPSGFGVVEALLNIVIVHGAWADGSSWSKVIPLLQAKGLHVVAVQNPLTSLADDVAATKRAIALQGMGSIFSCAFSQMERSRATT